MAAWIRQPRGVVALGGVLALILTGCGLNEEEQTAADSLAVAMVTSSSPEAVKDTSPCVAEKWVGEVGRSALNKAGLLNPQDRARTEVVRRTVAGKHPVPRPVARGYGRSWYACADFDAMSLDLGKAVPRASEEDLDEYADCLKEIDRDAWERARTRLVLGRGNGTPAAEGACRRELTRAARG